jgi:sugar transferase EpsL
MTAAGAGGLARRLKRAVDVVGAAAGLTLAAPLLAGVAVAVRRELGAPVFFRQRRAGYRGQPFDLIKFRTMKPAPPGLSATAAVASDAERLTPLGRLLREASLDELPTLWNVLRGDMSLVGPRPLLLEYTDRYTPAQARRLDVLPGVTGWAQVNGRNSRPWNEKFALDTWYVENWSLRLDLAILLRTVMQVIRREGISRPGVATAPVFQGTRAARPN